MMPTAYNNRETVFCGERVLLHHDVGNLQKQLMSRLNYNARTYPGMRADFRVIKPVSDGFDECEEAAFGGECSE
eukprot:1176957-Prorocentrum_minimum.AAC.1